MTLKVLFVEDVPLDMELTAAELRRAGIEFVARRVDTEHEMLRELDDFKPDVVLSDFSMPRFNALAALELVHQRSPGTPFIVVSGTIGEDTAVESLKRGATDYILKSNLLRLPAAVARAIAEAEELHVRLALEHELRESEKRYRALFESNPHPMWVYDVETLLFLAVNDTAVARYGFSRTEFLAMAVTDIRAEDQRPRVAEDEAGSLPAAARTEPGRYRTKQGELIDVEISSHDLVLEGTRARIVVAYDVTERNRQQEKIARLSRIHAVLSGINAAIVRIRNRQELFQEACRIAVDHGGFRMAWIGVVDDSGAKVEPQAWAGFEDGYLETVARLSLDADNIKGQGVAGRALRNKTPIVTNDFATDAQITYKREHLDRGYRSGVVLPLTVGEKATGLLSLYATEAGFFDDAELNLLRELAGDISFALEFIEKEARLNHLAYYDALTGLANRSLLHDRLEQALQFADRHSLEVAVLVIDLDRFKLVNDTLGHTAGDVLLRFAAARLVGCVRGSDTVARIGGDEFVVVLNGAALGSNSVVPTAQRILDTFAQSVNLDGREVFVTCSIGIALYPRDGRQGEILLKHADAAMYLAKDQGRSNYQFYAAGTNAQAAERLSLEAGLRRAIERNELCLHYQPQVDLRTGEVCGLEALIRWQRLESGMVSPAQFIPLAEETGLILPIGEWVLRTACFQNKAWQDQGLSPLRVAVNLSARQFRQKELAGQIRSVLAETGLDPQYLEVELTESMLMQNVEPAIDIMHELRSAGVKISLDDFGTSYSSLSYLKRFPIDTLKIDKSFVRDIAADPGSAAIADAIIAMAHSLRLSVIAEGVENEGQLAFLQAQGCDQMQGFLFSKPLATDELAQLLRDQRRLW